MNLLEMAMQVAETEMPMQAKITMNMVLHDDSEKEVAVRIVMVPEEIQGTDTTTAVYESDESK